MLRTLVFGIVLCVYGVSGGIFEDGFSESDLSAFIETTMNCRHIPGMSMSIVKGNETWAKGFGKANIDADLNVDNTTLFNIGSVTKSFTMTILGMLLTERKMDWTANVIDILGPGYGFIDEYRTQQITLKDLLSHRTGLARLDIGLFAGIPESLSRSEYCRRMKYAPEERPFRDEFIYNNYMYMMLGHVAEKLGDDSWENLVASRIFEPLGMTSTKILREPNDVLQDGMARPYILNDGQFVNGTLNIYNLHPIEPAGAILSSAVDMAKYMRFVLKNGTTENGSQLLDEDLMKQAFRSVTTLPDPGRSFLTRPHFPASDTPMGYGLAWFTSTYNGYRRFWHSGGLFSYITLVWIFPDQDIGFFASVNGPAYKDYSINTLLSTFYHTSDLLTGNILWINITNTCTIDELWEKPNKTEKPNEISVRIRNAGEYTGIFGSAFLPSIDIQPDPESDENLLFEMGKLGGKLHSTQEKDRFLMEVTYPWEFMSSFIDDNNVTTLINSTFHRVNTKVETIDLAFEVNITYKRDFSIFDDVPVSASSYPPKCCTTVLKFGVVVLVFVLTIIYQF